MFPSQPRFRIYSGEIVLGSQPRNWIKYHRSFASKDWFESQVKYGKWIRERNKPSKFLIYVAVLEGTVLIKIKYCPQGNINCPHDHVYVEHAHLIPKKRRR